MGVALTQQSTSGARVGSSASAISDRMNPIPDFSTYPERSVIGSPNSASAQSLGTLNLPVVRDDLRGEYRQPHSRQSAPGHATPPSAPVRGGIVNSNTTSHAQSAPSMASVWGVEVGSYASSSLARMEAEKAMRQIPSFGGHVSVEQNGSDRSRTFSARVAGLSRNEANAACGKIRDTSRCVPVMVSQR